MIQSLAPTISQQKLELSLEKALILKDQLLLSPGNWNGDEYSKELIQEIFENTDWNELRHSHLYLDHKDTQEKSGVGAWAGFIRNPRLNEMGELRGDLEIWHPMAAVWARAHPKFGVSATISAPEGNPDSFESFSIVHDPACTPAVINLSEDKIMTKIKELEKKNKELENKLNSINSPLENETQLNMEKNMVEEEKAEEEQEESEEEVKEESELSKEVKVLSEKLSKLTSIVEKKILAEDAEEEDKSEEKPEEKEEVKEESNEISEVKKELSKLRKELRERDERPEVKTLAAQAKELSREDSNIGMLRFLQARVM